MELNVNKKKEITWGEVFVKFVVSILSDLLNSWVVMVFWNWVAVDVLLLPDISYWQAFGLFTLSRILFTRQSVQAELKD